MTETNLTDKKDSIPFYPDHVRTEFWVVVGVTAITFLVGILGIFLPVGLGDPADPMNTPAHVKPEWYFLGLYQILKYVPKTLGVLIPIIALLLITILPFIDRKPDISRSVYRTRFILVLVGVIVFIALTIWGEVS